MLITADKLSLLATLVPLQQKPDNNSVRQDGRFAEKLEKAIGGGESLSSGAVSKASELAESLTLQMLQSSLALTSDPVSDVTTSSGTAPFSSATAILNAYRNNLSFVEESVPVVPARNSSQLQDLSDDVSPAAPVLQTSKSHTDPSWLDPVIAKASKKYGVDVGLIKAVIKAESDFNPQAVSHAGARGLMQLMPATARSLGVNDSFDPEQNVMGGTRFLKDMLQRYRGNVDSALAAYNWGPGNVDKRPDHLPRETRDYLARVKLLYASYSS